jgi:hypothetical protein
MKFRIAVWLIMILVSLSRAEGLTSSVEVPATLVCNYIKSDRGWLSYPAYNLSILDGHYELGAINHVLRGYGPGDPLCTRVVFGDSQEIRVEQVRYRFIKNSSSIEANTCSPVDEQEPLLLEKKTDSLKPGQKARIFSKSISGSPAMLLHYLPTEQELKLIRQSWSEQDVREILGYRCIELFEI